MSEPGGPVESKLPVEVGLCRHCRHSELLAGVRSTFLKCRLAEIDPRFSRYPPLPVLDCLGFESRASQRHPEHVP